VGQQGGAGGHLDQDSGGAGAGCREFMLLTCQ
jgi:hypothetical protein